MGTDILQNNRSILHLDDPIRNVALWHVTKRCNMDCKYCYGTFNGSSYKSNIYGKDFSYDAMTSIVDFLSEAGTNRVHLCGGEPFLYHDFYRLLKHIHHKKIESFVLSNLTFLPDYIENLFYENTISNLSFSLDSLDKNYNAYIRGAHDNVVKNVKSILDYKQKHQSNIEIGMYVVVTKRNIGLLKPLIEWAVEKGVNYITLQSVYLPKNHKYFNELSLTDSDIVLLDSIFSYLNIYSDRIRVSGSLLRYITTFLIRFNDLEVKNCFVEKNSNYFFIDGNGIIKTCTTKNNIVGKIENDNLHLLTQKQCADCCTDFCLDCIGIWEMVYPKDFNKHITIFNKSN